MKIFVLFIYFISPLLLANETQIDLPKILENKPWAVNGIDQYILDTYDDLTRKNKFSPFRASESLNQNFCYQEKALGFRGKRGAKRTKCGKVNALYSLKDHHVYYDPTHPLLEANLLHEIIHAYQYRVRFPWDVTLLYTALELGKIQEKDFFDYLSYYYESQANWYAATLGHNPYWNRVYKREKYKNSAVGVAVFMGLYYINPLAAVLHSFTQNNSLTNYNPNTYLKDNDLIIPYQDVKAMQDAGIKTYFPYPYQYSELIVQKLPKDMDLPLALTFSAYAKAIEKSYFGNLEFLFDFKAQDQKIFTSLHNQYYDNVGHLNTSGCDKVLSYIDSGASPLNQWLNISEEQLAQCKAYSTVSLKALNFYKKLLQKKRKSPFIISRDQLNHEHIHPGSEGSKPNLPIQPGSEGSKPSLPIQPGSEGSKPSLLIQPQLEISP